MINFFLKKYANWKKKPFLRMSLTALEDGRLRINADFNEYFINSLDSRYTANGNRDYSIMMQEPVKVAFFLSDQFDAIIGTYDKLSSAQDYFDEFGQPLAGLDPLRVPTISEAPVRQVVDINDNLRQKRIINSEGYDDEE